MKLSNFLPVRSRFFWLMVGLVVASTTETIRAEDKLTSPITDGVIRKDGKPTAFSKARHPVVEEVTLFAPDEHDWKYSHHQSLAAFGKEVVASWSSSERNEDSPGQRVMYSYRGSNGWSAPRILFQPDINPDGKLAILTASGFYAHEGTLVAYAGEYSITGKYGVDTKYKATRLLARTSTDGRNWSPVRDLHVPVCPNHSPQRTASGRLILSGNTAFPYTDDPAGLTGWKMTGVYPATMENFEDNPATFWDVAEAAHLANLCEATFFQTDDAVIHMLLRSCGKSWPPPSFNLWETQSTDNGVTWSTPRETSFSNTDCKFHFGRLPDGRFYCVGNPIGVGRYPLVLSVSKDGVHFDQQFILGDEHYRRRFDGMSKGGDYSYPDSLVHDGFLYVIFARQKEVEVVTRVALSELAEPAR